MARQQTGGRNKAVFFLIGSLMVAGLVTVMIFQVIQRFQRAAEEARKERDNLVTVVVASQDLYMGLPIAAEDLATKRVLPDTIDPDYVFADPADVVGRTPRERILADEILRVERLARADAGVGLNAIITPGRRAMTIETDTESGMAGLLQPGNYVDVIVTIRPDDEKEAGGKWVTETILQTVRILAVGTQLGSKVEDDGKSKKNQARQRPSVTLELTLDEAEKLALASSRGDLHLVMRSDIDIVQQQTDGPLTSNTLLGLTIAQKVEQVTAAVRTRPSSSAAAPQPDKETAVVIQGSSTTVETFEDGAKVEEEKKNSRRSNR